MLATSVNQSRLSNSPPFTLPWKQISDRYWTLLNGRFDLMPCREGWYVIDSYEGKTLTGTLEQCEEWVGSKTGGLSR